MQASAVTFSKNHKLLLCRKARKHYICLPKRLGRRYRRRQSSLVPKPLTDDVTRLTTGVKPKTNTSKSAIRTPSDSSSEPSLDVEESYQSIKYCSNDCSNSSFQESETSMMSPESEIRYLESCCTGDCQNSELDFCPFAFLGFVMNYYGYTCEPGCSNPNHPPSLKQLIETVCCEHIASCARSLDLMQ